MNSLLQYIFPLKKSLRVRILSLVYIAVMGVVILLALYILQRFEAASVFQLEHEAEVLSNSIEAAIQPFLAGEPDVAELQAHINRVASIRDKNDIEINIMLLEGYRSSIVASNIRDNVGNSSIYEHRDLLAALESGEAIMFIGRDIDSPFEPPATPSSPDYYIRSGQRFVSITSPLILDGKGVGSINTKLSLAQIDKQLGRIRSSIILMGLTLPLIAMLLVLWAVQRGLRPLDKLAREVDRVEYTNLGHRFSAEAMPTELKPIIIRLNELLERLESAFHRERRFTANVAHELRTPIATLKTLAEVGIQEAAKSERQNDSLEFYTDALAISRQMENMVGNLLGLVRCESGLQKTDVSALNLRETISRAWEAHKPGMREKGIKASLNLADTGLVHSDKSLVEAILGNLLSNAVTYTERNGIVECSLEQRDGHCTLSLLNSHNGLTEEDMGNLFEPFWRKDRARTDQAHCGIGLSLVAAYADLLNADLTADLPTPDRFRITIKLPNNN